MRVFACENCGAEARFGAQRCGTCGRDLAYLDDERDIRVLDATSQPAVYTVAGRAGAVWRCLNSAWGCNWTVPAGATNPWCRACQLTRGRPDEARPDAIEAWAVAEAAKRRLLHQLDEMALPVEPRSPTAPDGLAFDFVHLPGEGGITGHLEGIVTLDLAEVDDRHRDDLRRRLGEPFRTVIGHLRHEVGHHYWNRLVGQSNELVAFRRLFGDERQDYREAIEQHYAGAHPVWDQQRFVSPYAAAHPLEDWAESFAHYLHIVDATNTAVAHGLLPHDRAEQMADLTTMIEAWRPVNAAINAIAESLGTPAVYPFDPSPMVLDKLAFVHRQIAAHTGRSRFYADHD